MSSPREIQDSERLSDLFHAAIAVPPNERVALLTAACADDALLLGELISLLNADEIAVEAEFLNCAAFEIEAQHTAAEQYLSRVGESYGPYKIIESIGEGGMGAVYLAERDDQEFAKRAAVKVIKRGMDTNFVLQRFRNERQILANLDHSNIARLLDGGTTSDRVPYFIMEYVEGQPITAYADTHGLAVPERLKLFRIVCSAVQYAHSHLVIHRDIKPSNILVTEEGEPKLLDFGIGRLLQADSTDDAELTATAVRVMTTEYASPEQVKGEHLTTSTDVYSLGVLLYELLTGHRPYRVSSRNPEEVGNAICEQQPEKPSHAISGQWSVVSGQKERDRQLSKDNGGKSIPQTAINNPKLLRGDLDNIVLKALRKEPQRRYASVDQFSEDIRRHLEGLPVSARKDTLSYRTSKFVQRNKIGVTAAAITLLILIAGIVSTSWEAHKARVQSARAQLRFNELHELARSVIFDYHDAIASLPGSTPVRERLVKDALRYLDELADDEGNSPSLQRELAAAYLKVGDVQGRPYSSNLGQSEGALASYRKAMAILEPLSAASQSDKELSRDLATVSERIGNILLRKGNWADALKMNNQALTMRQALLATDPSNKSYRGDVADSYVYVGDALQVCCLDVECVRRALESQRRALEIRQDLAKEDPSDRQIQRGVAQAYTRVGFRQEYIGRYGDKGYLRLWLESEQASLAIRKELAAADPMNALDRRNFADQLMLTGTAQLENENTPGALNRYRGALDIFKGLSSADPTNSEARRDLSFVYMGLAAAYAKTGNARKARENYAAVIPIDGQLLAADPTNQEDLQNLAATYIKLGDLSSTEGDLLGAIENCRKVVDVRERMLTITPDNSAYVSNLADAYFHMGFLQAETAGAHVGEGGILDATILPPTSAKQMQQWRDAKSWYQKNIDILRAMKSKGTLFGADANRIDELEREIAKCDAALASSKAQ